MLHVWGENTKNKRKKNSQNYKPYISPRGRKYMNFQESEGQIGSLALLSMCSGKKKKKKRPPLESEGSTRFSTHLITVLTWFSLINDNHQMPSCGRMTSGSLADTPGNSVNDFGDGSGCVMLLSLLSGLHYPLQYLFTLSSHSLPILILWNLDTFIQICPMPFMASTYQAFNIFPSAPVHF